MGLSGGLPLNPFDKHHFPHKHGHELAGIPVINNSIPQGYLIFLFLLLSTLVSNARTRISS